MKVLGKRQLEKKLKEILEDNFGYWLEYGLKKGREPATDGQIFLLKTSVFNTAIEEIMNMELVKK